MNLMPLSTSSSHEVQNRLLAATEALVYAGGIHATGIDAIVKRSGTARKSVYTHFGSKEQLVAAALSARHMRWMDWFIAGTEATGKRPEERLLGMFDILRTWFIAADFHGCAFLNAAGELPSHDDPIRDIARHHKAELLAYVQSLIDDLGAREPRLARQFLILIDGAISVALVDGDPDAALDARAAAARLLDSVAPPPSHQQEKQ